LASPAILGRELWQLITDLTLQHLFDGLFHRLRSGQIAQATYLFRCDTPVSRRLHRLTITPAPGQSLRFQARIVAVHQRPRIPLLDASVPRSSDLLRICSWCKRIPLPSGGWVEIEEALEQLPVLDTGPLPALTHTMCPACERAVPGFLRDPSASGPGTASFGDWHSA
jgi:hypothetical protein